MGKTTVMQEVRKLYCFYKELIRDGKEIAYQQVYGTRQKQRKMLKEIERYSDYARIDFDYGILNDNEYISEMQIINELRTTVLKWYGEVSKEENDSKRST